MRGRYARRGAPCFAVAALAMSCGSGSGGGSGGGADEGGANGIGSASVMGPIGGKVFTPMDAVAYFPGNIAIVDFAGLCAHGLSDAKAGATYINMFLGNGFELGTTQVGGTGATLTVQTIVVDSRCNSVGDSASSGSVTLTKVEPDAVGGTFDFTFTLGGHLTGSFSAAMCTMAGSAACK